MDFDVVINGARVMDPETGLDAVKNIGVRNGKIEAVTDQPLQGAKVVDAKGLIAAPGFIDIHVHEDIIGYLDLISLPKQTSECALKTGNTTIVTGNCGFSALPTSAYVKALAEAKLPINNLFLVGNVSLRQKVGLGTYDTATPAQIKEMERLLAEGLEAGAAGVSFGLEYNPGTTTEEMAALCRVTAPTGKFASVHMRYDTPEKAVETVQEVVGVAEQTGIPLQISHLTSSVYGPGRVEAVAEIITKSSADITTDVYPFNAWSTNIQSAVFDGGFESFHFDISDVQVLTGPYAGQFCTKELFDELRNAPEDTLTACHNAMPIEDVELAYTLPFAMVGSDGEMILEDGHIKGHPRGSSTPAKFLSHFVREKKCCSLMEGINKLTLMPAKRCKLDKKGRLQEGCDADITLFDYDKLEVLADFGIDVCATPPKGIAMVLVDGKIAYDNTGAPA